MAGFFGRGKERGSQGAPNVPESTPVSGDTPFRIRSVRTVEAQVLYGDPKHPMSLGVSLSLADTTSIIGQDLGDGTVRGVLDSDVRKLALNQGKHELEREESALAQDFVKKQRDLQAKLDEARVGQGSLVRIVLTAPSSSLLV
jgi:hypothetical protein